MDAERIGPEYSVLSWQGRRDFVERIHHYQGLRKYPKGAGAARESFGWYAVVDSSRVGRDDKIVDLFVRWRE